MQNNVPFYDNDRLCTYGGTLLGNGEFVIAIGWLARQIPTMETMDTLSTIARQAIPGSTVLLKPMVDAGVNVIITDAGVRKTIPVYALANAYLGGPAGSRPDAVRRFVRDLPYDD